MKLNNYNEIVVKENDLVEAMLEGKTFEKVITYNPEIIDQFNHFSTLFKFGDEIEVSNPSRNGEDKYSYKNADNWWIPEEFKQLNIVDYILGLSPRENYDRCFEELEEFNKRDMFPVLKFLVYMVAELKSNNILWGVGRGSSVSSYILYLIGVHKVDSIKYDLDYKEFLR